MSRTDMSSLLKRARHRFARWLYRNRLYNLDLFQYPGGWHYKKYGNTEYKYGKIAIIGLPKTGNNWLSYLLAESLGMPYVHHTLEGVPGISGWHLPIWNEAFRKKDVSHAVYIMRDVRDVICSYYPYSQTEDFRSNVDPACRFDSMESFYFEYFYPVVTAMYDWFNHANDYSKARIPVVKYENLWNDALREMKRLFSMWGISHLVSEDNIVKAIENNNLNKLKVEGKSFRREMPPSHFRKGGSRNFENEMPSIVLEHVNEKFRHLIVDWGYVL
ncbi:MAG: sulfotransferase domain-containing protein [Planctomycetes bacterium]|nr:sulfotransferase domain-containing protein [Planctomycetota bacterium]